MKLVLIVDDANFMRRDLERVISKNYDEISILQFDNGRSALNFYKELCHGYQEISAIIMDHTMPEMSGIEACKQMLQINKNAPILAFTGSLNAYQKFHEIGIKNRVHKPVTESQIIEVLDPYLK